METKIIQKIGLTQGPSGALALPYPRSGSTYWHMSFNAVDVFSDYLSYRGDVYLKKVELLDLCLIVQNTSSNTYLYFYGKNPVFGFDVSGVYETLLSQVSIVLPKNAFYRIREYNYPSYNWLTFDMLENPVDFGRQLKVGSLSPYRIDVNVLPLSETIFTNLDWQAEAQDGILSHSFMQIMYTLEYDEILNT